MSAAVLCEEMEVVWPLMYAERWLKAPMLKADGVLVRRTKGTPQGQHQGL